MLLMLKVGKHRLLYFQGSLMTVISTDTFCDKSTIWKTSAPAVSRDNENGELKIQIRKMVFVLLKESRAKRHNWPVGLIMKTFPSDDGKIRKVQVIIVREGGQKQFLRPIS